MKNQFANDIIQKMLPYIDNAQADKLRQALFVVMENYEVSESSTRAPSEPTNENLVCGFLSAKRIEGCSEKSLIYYRKTIDAMLVAIGKGVSHITTDDLRSYLTGYQSEKNSSKVTIDNIRRILSSFFSWLEDEDYILKSPVRRIHKVKSASTIKETYSDEELKRIVQAFTTGFKPYILTISHIVYCHKYGDISFKEFEDSYDMTLEQLEDYVMLIKLDDEL